MVPQNSVAFQTLERSQLKTEGFGSFITEQELAPNHKSYASFFKSYMLKNFLNNERSILYYFLITEMIIMTNIK